MRSTVLPIAFVLVSSFAAAALAGVAVVDPQGQPGTALLQSTIDAAANGDIILVRAGSYPTSSTQAAITLAGKGLTIVNDSAGQITLPPFTIKSVPHGSYVLLRGLNLCATTPLSFGLSHFPGAVVANCSGMIWFEDCDLRGEKGADFGFGGLPASVGLSVTASPNVALERCVVTGGIGTQFTSFGTLVTIGPGGGAVLESSTLVAHDSVIRGGVFAPMGSTGQAAGLTAKSSRLLAAGCEIQGASWGGGGFQFCMGIHFLDTANQVWLRATTVEVGTTSTGTPSFSDPITGTSQLTQLPAPPLGLEVTALARAGDPVEMRVDGAPGTTAGILVGGFGTDFLIPSPYQNALLLSLSFSGPIVLGTIPPSGVLTLHFTAPPLPSTSPAGMTVGLQAFTLAPHFTVEAASTFVQVMPGL